MASQQRLTNKIRLIGHILEAARQRIDEVPAKTITVRQPGGGRQRRIEEAVTQQAIKSVTKVQVQLQGGKLRRLRIMAGKGVRLLRRDHPACRHNVRRKGGLTVLQLSDNGDFLLQDLPRL